MWRGSSPTPHLDGGRFDRLLRLGKVRMNRGKGAIVPFKRLAGLCDEVDEGLSAQRLEKRREL